MSFAEYFDYSVHNLTLLGMVMRFLAATPEKVYSRETLMEHVWNYDGFVGDVRAVDVAVRRLREKIEDDPASPEFIMTRRGLGYLFRAG